MIAIGVSADYIFEEKKSGLDSTHPTLKDAVRFARWGDTFCISRIDRLARLRQTFSTSSENFARQAWCFVCLIKASNPLLRLEWLH